MRYPRRALTLNGSGIAGTGVLLNVSGNNTYGGSVTLQINSSIGANAGTQLTITGAVKDPTPTAPQLGAVPAAVLTKVGSGTLVFPNSNPYSGKTVINGGVLNIRNAGSLGTSGPEVQTVTVMGTIGSFTLTFTVTINGVTATSTTIALDVASPTLAADIQAALNDPALASIAGVGGSVVVTQGSGSNSNVYSVTFGGTLGKLNLQQMTSATTAGVTATMSTVRDGPEGTQVNSGATLQIQGNINVSTELLTLNGTGFNNTRALDNVSGNNIWTAPVAAQPIILAGNTSIGSDAGTLTLNNAPIGDSGSGFTLTKVGVGTVRETGTLSNQYTGNTFVNDGTLQLGLTGGAVAVLGNLIVGDGLGAGSDTAQLLQSNQIANPSTATVLVNSDGQFVLGDATHPAVTQTVNSVNVLGGAVEVRGANNSQLTTPTLTMTGGNLRLTGDSSQVVATALTETDATATLSGAFSQLTTSALNMTGGTINLTTGSSQVTLTGDVTATADAGDVPAVINGLGAVPQRRDPDVHREQRCRRFSRLDHRRADQRHDLVRRRDQGRCWPSATQRGRDLHRGDGGQWRHLAGDAGERQLHRHDDGQRRHLAGRRHGRPGDAVGRHPRRYRDHRPNHVAAIDRVGPQYG